MWTDDVLGSANTTVTSRYSEIVPCYIVEYHQISDRT